MNVSPMPASVERSAARGSHRRSGSANTLPISSMMPDPKQATSPACQDKAIASSIVAPRSSAINLIGSITRKTCAKRLTVLIP